MARELEVSINNIPIGTLLESLGALQFAYTPAWLNNRLARPLSRSLPLQADPYSEQALRPYFGGLLPTGKRLRLAARTLRTTEQDLLTLLQRLGGDCPGDVSFSDASQLQLFSEENPSIHWLMDQSLSAFVKNLPEQILLAEAFGVRALLPGETAQVPVVIEGGQIGLPCHGYPSTHILKTTEAAASDTLYGELFGLRLAAAAGIRVAANRLAVSDGHPYLLLARSDRKASPGGDTEAVYSETLAQAVGSAASKEPAGQAVQCFEIVRQSIRPGAPALLQLLDIVTFTLLIGSAPALAEQTGLVAATAANKSDLALALTPLAAVQADYSRADKVISILNGNAKRFSDLSLGDWEQFVRSAGFSWAQSRKRIVALAQRLQEAAPRVQQDIATQCAASSPSVTRLVERVQKRAAATVQTLSAA